MHQGACLLLRLDEAYTVVRQVHERLAYVAWCRQLEIHSSMSSKFGQSEAEYLGLVVAKIGEKKAWTLPVFTKKERSNPS